MIVNLLRSLSIRSLCLSTLANARTDLFYFIFPVLEGRESEARDYDVIVSVIMTDSD